SGTVVWAADYDPFGTATVMVSAVENNMRLPGQYYDSETGLHYNYHRYYDPSIGRYLTPDPIGLDGGINLYAYVSGNPVNFSDPYGLDAITITATDVAVRTAAAKATGGTAATIGLSGIAFIATGIVLGTPSNLADGTLPPYLLDENTEDNNCPIPDTEPGRSTKGRTDQRTKPGDIETANGDFDRLNPTDVKDIPYGGRRGILPDGRKINVRPNSSDGRPTIEIQNGKRRIKIRYGR
ncbi:MAG: RHS repeat-associated core domain-containing protein, partial [Desulfobacteraceae bacterium]